jgi:hypothetical protein
MPVRAWSGRPAVDVAAARPATFVAIVGGS